MDQNFSKGKNSNLGKNAKLWKFRQISKISQFFSNLAVPYLPYNINLIVLEIGCIAQRLQVWRSCWNSQCICYNPISVFENCRDCSDTPKLLQWPHSYLSYKTKYSLKPLLFEKFTKKNLMPHEYFAENRFFTIFSKSKHFKLYMASQLSYKCGHCRRTLV